ncbi:transcription activator [Fusarium denticulatum]|uniref:Transcription activator n=1 Tax=Fusarium denticulatum TaxID=48507 RepID=A0A8H5UEJ1_9HYPO|nr:transcription activator [Fusarium denticulatum]
MPACHGCRVRKVKCDDGNPCSPCRQFDVQCIRSTAPRKRQNPKRGRLVAQAREANLQHQQPNALSPSASVSPSAVHSTPHAASEWPPGSSPGSAISGPYSPNSEAYTTGFFHSLLPEFEKVVYPFSPAITPDEIVRSISMMHHNFEDAALIYAYAAVTTFLSQTADNSHGSVAAQINNLVYHSLEAQHRAAVGSHGPGRVDEVMPHNIKRIVTCIYLEISTMGLPRLDRSFSFIREAISLIQIMEAHQRTLPDPTRTPYPMARFQQVYWEAYIHERFLTIADGYPSIMGPLHTNLSAPDSSTPEHIRVGFNCLIELFLTLDETFLACWQSQRGAIGGLTVQWIESKQVQLDQAEMNAAAAEARMHSEGHAGFTELQRADLFITRLWLRTLLWQLALSQGLLRSGSSDTTHEGLSLQFPASRLSIQLRSLVGQLDSIVSIATQGSGIIQKLFEIASTIADVLALPSGHSQAEDGLRPHVKDFLYVVNFLLELGLMRENQKDYLREKYRMLQPLNTEGRMPAHAGEQAVAS